MRPRGFTLIELMIVVAIIGILSMVAFPSYEKYLIKGRRGAAQSFMTQIMSKEEEYFVNNRAYLAVSDGSTAGLTTLHLAAPSETDGFYTYAVLTLTSGSLVVPTGGYLVVATRKTGSSQVKDDVGDLTLSSAGQKASTGVEDPKWK